jgi:predicted TIM-barrel fold metal-dependent hydrolase
MKTVDADTHIHECAAMWEHIDPEFYSRRPIQVTLPEDTVHGDFNAAWIIDGKLYPKPVGQGLFFFRTPTTSLATQKTWAPVGAQSLEDIPARLADMDNQGIDYQVVFPSLFLAPMADDTKVERAVCQSYNRYVSKACARSEGRIYFTATLPWRDVDDAVAVLREAKDLGAVAAWLPGVMWDRPLSDPYFYPLFEELSRLKLPLAIHFAWGCPGLHQIYKDQTSQLFPAGVVPVILGFEALLTNGVYDEFPDLTVAFVEAGSEWVPYVVNQLDRRYDQGGLRNVKRRPSDTVKSGQIYVTVEAVEDIPYVAQFTSEDYLVIGSDYPHLDPSHEKEMIAALNENTRVSDSLREKILSTNALRLYNLPA